MELMFSLNNIAETVQMVWQAASQYKVWAFHGEMGAGKTTFIKSLCEYLQTSSHAASPTYSIINEYWTQRAGKVYHMDWYRLKGEEEAMQAGAEETLDSGHLCLVEWPEMAAGLLPGDALHLYLTVISSHERRLVVNYNQ